MFKHSHKAQTTQLASCFTSSLTLPHTNQVRSIAWECRWSWENDVTTKKKPPRFYLKLPRNHHQRTSGRVYYLAPSQPDVPVTFFTDCVRLLHRLWVGGLWCGDRILNATKTNRYFAVRAILRRFCSTEFAYQLWETRQATNLTQERYTKKLLCALMAVADRLMIMIFLHYDTTDCVHTIEKDTCS